MKYGIRLKWHMKYQEMNVKRYTCGPFSLMFDKTNIPQIKWKESAYVDIDHFLSYHISHL